MAPPIKKGKTRPFSSFKRINDRRFTRKRSYRNGWSVDGGKSFIFILFVITICFLFCSGLSMHQTCRDKNESTVLFLFFDDTEDESTKQKVKSSEVKSMVYICSLPFFSFSFLFAFVSLILVLRPNVSIVSGLIVNQPKPIKNGVGLDQERTQREKLQERRKQRVSRMSYRWRWTRTSSWSRGTQKNRGHWSTTPETCRSRTGRAVQVQDEHDINSIENGNETPRIGWNIFIQRIPDLCQTTNRKREYMNDASRRPTPEQKSRNSWKNRRIKPQSIGRRTEQKRWR